MLKRRLKSHADVAKKRSIQQEIFSFIRSDKIMALAGPNVDNYYKVLKQAGFKDITFFENDPFILGKQLEVSGGKYKLIFDDIINNLDSEAFYDLDFCCSVNSLGNKLRDINKLKEYTMTVSVRPVGFNKTLETLKRYENGGNYSYYYYTDTSPMITVTKTQIYVKSKSEFLLRNRDCHLESNRKNAKRKI